MNSGATTERVYDALKRHLQSGGIAPGDKLDPARFAEELHSSVTPVRDALHRLVGERLVETRLSEGFHQPRATEPGLRDLYSWNLAMLRSVIAAWPRTGPLSAANDLPVDIERATPHFFERCAERSGNVEMAATVAGMNDRLATARVAERQRFGDLESELRALALAADTGTPREVARQIQAYHRRRLRAVPEIVHLMYRGGHPQTLFE